MAGTGPRAVPSGDTCEPAPIANPGPTNQDAAQITRLGTKASWPAVRAIPPTNSVCRDSYSLMSSV